MTSRGETVIKQAVFLLCLGAAGLAAATEPVDQDMVNRIRQEAFHHSQVMDLVGHLTEDIGPRLTASPQMAAANRWTGDRFRAWGLANVHDEAFADFGRGWEFTAASVDLLAPRVQPLHALPKAWTPGTAGPVEGEALRVTFKTRADLDTYRGKLKGKVLLLDAAREYKPGTDASWQRYDADELAGMGAFEIPGARRDVAGRLKGYAERMELARALNAFLVEEGALATLEISGWDNGIIRAAGGGSRKAGESVGVPALVMAAEHYNPLVRALERKETVRLRLDVAARFTSTEDQPGYNTLAEIPGSGAKAREVVMLGAHMDSWHTGTGAADNAAGVAVMMEAMRILKAVGARPKRTIRVALWSGEEQGLIGSRAYVAEHFAEWPEPTDAAQKALPSFLRQPTGPLRKKAEYEQLSAYFNMDNGSGRFRGIYAQENAAAIPIFEAWLAPFHDVGATTVVSRNTGSTDHVAFDAVGLPGFQFIQDRLDYFSHVHHSNLDTLDHVDEQDLKQAAAIVATFVWQAATREERMPRKPEPRPAP